MDRVRLASNAIPGVVDAFLYPTFRGGSHRVVMTDSEVATTVMLHMVNPNFVMLITPVGQPLPPFPSTECRCRCRSYDGKRCGETFNPQMTHSFACRMLRYPTHQHVLAALEYVAKQAGVGSSSNTRVQPMDWESPDEAHLRTDLVLRGTNLSMEHVDVTIRSPLLQDASASYKRGKIDLQRPCRHAANHKHRLYGPQLEAQKMTLTVAGVTHLGVMNPAFLSLLHRLAAIKALDSTMPEETAFIKSRQVILASLFAKTARTTRSMLLQVVQGVVHLAPIPTDDSDVSSAAPSLRWSTNLPANVSTVHLDSLVNGPTSPRHVSPPTPDRSSSSRGVHHFGHVNGAPSNRT